MLALNLTNILIIACTLSVAAQWLAWRLQWPALVLLIIIGIILGPIAGVLRPAQQFGPEFYPFVELFVALILFEGGMNLHWHEFKDVSRVLTRLVSYAVPISWILGASAAHYLVGLSWAVSLVFGAIMVVTGPTVIMPLLRHTSLKRRPASYLKWEAIINDPIGALLTVLVFNYFAITETTPSIIDAALTLIISLSAGVVSGWLAAQIIYITFTRGWVPEFLKPLVLLMSVFILDSLTNMIFLNVGLLACTLFGLFLVNTELPEIVSLRRFKEYITILVVSMLFILLTADLDFSIFVNLHFSAVGLVFVMIFVVRPLTIYLATWRSEMTKQERHLLAWLAPRGIVAAAVAAVIGPQLVDAGYPDGADLMPLVFGMVLATVILHGFTINFLANYLGLSCDSKNGVLIVGANAWSIELAKLLQSMQIPVMVADYSWFNLKNARLTGIPVYYGEVLSEDAEQSLDFGYIGTLIACTSNDAYNALVCSHYISELGRNKVYQLASPFEDDPKGLHRSLRGKSLLKEKSQYDQLMRNFYLGYQFQKTRITEAYTSEQYWQEQPEQSTPIAYIRKEAVHFFTDETETKLQKDDIILAFQIPKPN